MKLRLDGKSVRLRLRRSEIQEFAENGVVSITTNLPGGAGFTVRLEAADVVHPAVAMNNAGISVQVPAPAAREWTASDQVGIYGEGPGLAIIVEKEFRRTSQTSPLDSDLYPNPRAPQQTA